MMHFSPSGFRALQLLLFVVTFLCLACTVQAVSFSDMADGLPPDTCEGLAKSGK